MIAPERGWFLGESPTDNILQRADSALHLAVGFTVTDSNPMVHDS